MIQILPALLALLLVPSAPTPHGGAPSPAPGSAALAAERYLADFEFLAETVERHGAALRVRDLDWAEICRAHRPRFEACEEDVEHVRNVMALLAELGDSHTGVTRHAVDAERLPGKWDGLFGGGLWLVQDDGRVTLRHLLAGHALATELAPGATLVAVDGLPTWLVLEREKRRITRWRGSSSDHSLFASMGNRMLPFGERRELACAFLDPDGERVRTVDVPRWGPGGKAASPLAATLPDGVEPADGAVSAVLATEWCERVGYVRITGSMAEATARAFHAAFDRLEDVECVLLDCRGMGGGGDGAAWDMAGRFFPKAVANGRGRRLEPTGAWQHAGPVVMLQDELEVSSAETFTWALVETERCVSVGRPTGGWSILPRGFECPSGLVAFRLGVTDRPTPIRGAHTEGVGTAPDVLVPLGPGTCAEPDAVRALGLEVLRALHAGARGKDVVAAFATLVGGDEAGWTRRARKLRKAGLDAEALAARMRADLERTLAAELALLRSPDVPPDALGLARRLPALAARAKAAGLRAEVTELEKALEEAEAERAAQEALLGIRDWDAAAREREAWLERHAETRTGALVRARVWGDE